MFLFANPTVRIFSCPIFKLCSPEGKYVVMLFDFVSTIFVLYVCIVFKESDFGLFIFAVFCDLCIVLSLKFIENVLNFNFLNFALSLFFAMLLFQLLPWFGYFKSWNVWLRPHLVYLFEIFLLRQTSENVQIGFKIILDLYFPYVFCNWPIYLFPIVWMMTFE